MTDEADKLPAFVDGLALIVDAAAILRAIDPAPTDAPFILMCEGVPLRVADGLATACPVASASLHPEGEAKQLASMLHNGNNVTAIAVRRDEAVAQSLAFLEEQILLASARQPKH